MAIAILLTIQLISAAVSVFGDKPPGSPMILVPGDGGSRIQLKLDHSRYISPFCHRNTDDFQLFWINPTKLVPALSLPCSLRRFELSYNKTTRKTSNQKGVRVEIPGFGDTETIQDVSSSNTINLKYYDLLVKQSLDWGYMPGKSVRGAPYDFRKAPNEHQDFFIRLKFLTEETYQLNDGARVTIMGHSMGCTMLQYFFVHQPQDWKDKFVRRFVCLAGPLGGAVYAVQAEISGWNLGLPSSVFPEIAFRPLLRSMPSTTFLMPSSKYWSANDIIATTPDRNYTTADYYDLFDDLGFPEGTLMYDDTKDLIHDLTFPGVDVTCIYGHGVQTPARYIYDHDFPDTNPKQIIYDDGDQVVNLRSLRACSDWPKEHPSRVTTFTLSNQTHVGMMNDQRMIDYLKNLVLGL